MNSFALDIVWNNVLGYQLQNHEHLISFTFTIDRLWFKTFRLLHTAPTMRSDTMTNSQTTCKRSTPLCHQTVSQVRVKVPSTVQNTLTYQTNLFSSTQWHTHNKIMFRKTPASRRIHDVHTASNRTTASSSNERDVSPQKNRFSQTIPNSTIYPDLTSMHNVVAEHAEASTGVPLLLTITTLPWLVELFS